MLPKAIHARAVRNFIMGYDAQHFAIGIHFFPDKKVEQEIKSTALSVVHIQTFNNKFNVKSLITRFSLRVRTICRVVGNKRVGYGDTVDEPPRFKPRPCFKGRLPFRKLNNTCPATQAVIRIKSA